MKGPARRGLLGALLAGALPGTGASAEPLGFERDLRPVFERHCVECHSGWFPSGGLRLNSLENILAGGPSGPAVIPGRPDKGWIPFAIRQTEGRYRMPPAPAVIDPADRQLILDWIEQGARP